MPEDHGIHTDFLLPWIRRIQAACPSLSFEVHCEGAKYGLLENQFAQVSSGDVDIAHSPASLPMGHFPLTNLINLPFLVEDSGQASERLWAAHAPYLQQEFAPLHILALHADSGGVLHWREGEIKSLDDFVGKRIRVPAGVLSAIMAAIGAIPVFLPPPAIAAAARSGELDGAIMAWDVLAYTQTQDIFCYHYEDVFYVSPLYLAMNPQSYRSLTGEERQTLDDHSGGHLTHYFGGYWHNWSAAGRELARRSGYMIGRLSVPILSQLREVAGVHIQRYIDELSGEDSAHTARIVKIFSGK